MVLTIAILVRVPDILILAMHLRCLSLLIPIVPLILISTASTVTTTYHGGRVLDSLAPGRPILPFPEADEDGYEEAQNSYDGTDDCCYQGCC